MNESTHYINGRTLDLIAPVNQDEKQAEQSVIEKDEQEVLHTSSVYDQLEQGRDWVNNYQYAQ